MNEIKQKLRRLLCADPFKPFTVYTKDGSRTVISDPELFYCTVWMGDIISIEEEP